MSTFKQKRLAKKLVENSSLSVGRAMIESGYSPITATHPSQVTNSIGFQQMLERYMPDTLLARTNKQALKAKRFDQFQRKEVPDWTNRIKAAELGYKVRGKLIPDQLTAVSVGDISIKIIEDKPLLTGVDSQEIG